MNKMYLKPIVNILLLFVVFFAINGCSKDDDNNTENKTEITLPKEAYRLQIVEAAFSEPLTQEEYDATLGEISVKLLRVDEQTLLFYIPVEVAVGSTTFTIPQLNVSQTLEVKNPELKGSEAVVLQPLFEKITPEYQDLYDPEYMDYLATVHTSFKDYYQTLSQEEKNDMALFYQVNEDFFVKILNPDLQEKNVKETVRIIKKFSVATFFFVGGSTALSLPGTPVEKAVIGAIAVTGAIKAWDYGKQLINQITVVTNITDNLLGGKAHNQSFNKSGISFVNDQPKSINLYIEHQQISATNRSSTASGLISFFDVYDGLISATKKVNEVIRFINDHVFFANISEIPVSEIPSTSETQTEAMTEEFYSYLKLSVADTNVEITESRFEEGAIRMKMSIKNLNIVTGESINTQLNYSYQEDFSSVTGSIPIEIKLEEGYNYQLQIGAGNLSINEEPTPQQTIEQGGSISLPNYMRQNVRLLLDGKPVDVGQSGLSWTPVNFGAVPVSSLPVYEPNYTFDIYDYTNKRNVTFHLDLTLTNDAYGYLVGNTLELDNKRLVTFNADGTCVSTWVDTGGTTTPTTYQWYGGSYSQSYQDCQEGIVITTKVIGVIYLPQNSATVPSYILIEEGGTFRANSFYGCPNNLFYIPIE